jgi:hypothetical protein
MDSVEAAARRLALVSKASENFRILDGHWNF